MPWRDNEVLPINSMIYGLTMTDVLSEHIYYLTKPTVALNFVQRSEVEPARCLILGIIKTF
jgi:hypothetical protein